jgi:molecular chaperone DnaK (HSP70)
MVRPKSSLSTPTLTTGPCCLLLLRITIVLILVSSTLGFLHDISANQLRSNINKRHHEHSGRIPSPSIVTALAAEIGVGIDLGTTNSAVAFLDKDNVPRIIEIPNNGRTMKSVVAFDENSEPLVGKEALDWEHQHKETAYRHVKRVIGTSFNNLSDETREVVPHLVPDSCGVDDKNDRGKKSYRRKKKKGPSLIRVLEDADNYPTKLFSLNDNGDTGKSCISPEDVSSCVLERLLNVASDHTGDSITKAVIGIPAYFNDAQKEATVRAAKACGIEKVKLLREPEAAALAYGFGKGNGSEEELVLVFDLGGGTYDVSVLTIGRGLTEIVCTSGNSQLGGTNFDTRIAKYLSKLVNRCCKSEDSMVMVLQAAESIRISLSNNKVVNFALPMTEDGWLELNEARDIIAPPSQAKHFEAGDNSNSTHSFHQLSRREMENLCKKEFQDLIRPIREVAIMSGAMLPGDASPSIVESAIEREKELSQLQNFYHDDNVDDTMPEDAGQQTKTTNDGAIDIRSAKKAQQKGRKKARETSKKERKYREESRKVQQPDNNNAKVRSEGISGRPISRIVLVGGATRMPTIGRIISSLTGVTPQWTVDPDEAVALGCAVHVGVLDGKEEMGVVLNPMKAALLRAAIEKERREGGMVDMFEDDDDDEFTNVESI